VSREGKMANTLIAYAHLPQRDRGEVQLLWHADYWDGPLNGLCRYRDRKCWFELCAEGEPEAGDKFYRRYLLLELGKDQLDEEEYWHRLFQEKVGTHADYGEAQREVKPRHSWAEFYEPYQKRGKVDYSANPALGWFEV
jgi:hypothetical protein